MAQPTTLPVKRVRKISILAKEIVEAPEAPSKESVRNLREQIRHMHDYADSFRMRGHPRRYPFPKYLGHAHWSQAALASLERNRGTPEGITNRRGKKPKEKLEDIFHAHIVPVRVLADILINNKPGTKLDVFEDQIRRLSVVAIITVSENIQLRECGLTSQMPPGWTSADCPWTRFEVAGLLDQITPSPAADRA